MNENSEDVLTRHLLKLSDVEKQFQELTNKFEEINFKLDKLSNRLSKVQADNQIRFQDVENALSSGEVGVKINFNTKRTSRQKFTRLFTTSRLRVLFHIKIQKVEKLPNKYNL